MAYGGRPNNQTVDLFNEQLRRAMANQIANPIYAPFRFDIVFRHCYPPQGLNVVLGFSGPFVFLPTIKAEIVSRNIPIDNLSFEMLDPTSAEFFLITDSTMIKNGSFLRASRVVDDVYLASPPSPVRNHVEIEEMTRSRATSNHSTVPVKSMATMNLPTDEEPTAQSPAKVAINTFLSNSKSWTIECLNKLVESFATNIELNDSAIWIKIRQDSLPQFNADEIKLKFKELASTVFYVATISKSGWQPFASQFSGLSTNEHFYRHLIKVLCDVDMKPQSTAKLVSKETITDDTEVLDKDEYQDLIKDINKCLSKNTINLNSKPVHLTNSDPPKTLNLPPPRPPSTAQSRSSVNPVPREKPLKNPYTKADLVKDFKQLAIKPSNSLDTLEPLKRNVTMQDFRKAEKIEILKLVLEVQKDLILAIENNQGEMIKQIWTSISSSMAMTTSKQHLNWPNRSALDIVRAIADDALNCDIEIFGELSKLDLVVLNLRDKADLIKDLISRREMTIKNSMAKKTDLVRDQVDPVVILNASSVGGDVNPGSSTSSKPRHPPVLPPQSTKPVPKSPRVVADPVAQSNVTNPVLSSIKKVPLKVNNPFVKMHSVDTTKDVYTNDSVLRKNTSNGPSKSSTPLVLRSQKYDLEDSTKLVKLVVNKYEELLEMIDDEAIWWRVVRINEETSTIKGQFVASTLRVWFNDLVEDYLNVLDISNSKEEAIERFELFEVINGHPFDHVMNIENTKRRFHLSKKLKNWI